MGGKKNKHIPKNSPIMPNQEEYDLKRSFSRLNRYRSSNFYQTMVDEEQDSYSPPVDSSMPKESGYNSITNQFGDSYFRLEDKISALSDKNDAAHDSLRKELEGKIDKAKVDVEQQIKDKKENRKWIIGTIIAIIVAIIGYIVLPYQKSNTNQQEIIKIQTTIDENLKPAIDKNSKAIEKNSMEIKDHTEKIYQIQNQQQKKQTSRQ
jgi:hypothetical protein